MTSSPERPEIAIRITSRDPMQGDVVAEAEEPEPFWGWLGLLKVLEERLSAGGTAPETSGGSQRCAPEL